MTTPRSAGGLEAAGVLGAIWKVRAAESPYGPVATVPKGEAGRG